ncbi:MAG: PD-(D/E)XK nuclease family protein [Actinomycetia bacterium]|nr:PD-(D/E)XK nuclease family protein [Actinomycetes bacterium]MCP4845808.1 PD-(D/E)XK nuclease family protein [Actinomycetes bacterium]
MSRYPYPTPPNPKADPQLEPCTNKLPKKLSPTAAKDFVQCPRLFFEKKVARSIVFESTEATTKGTLVHHALEKIFDHDRADRTPDNAVTYVRPEWDRLVTRRDYGQLAAMAPERIEAMLAEAEEMVREYFTIEDPTKFDPAGREQWVTARMGDATMNGVIDRFDAVPDGAGNVRHYITDYKTGKLPRERYEDEAFFAMRIYAAGIRETKGVTVDAIRLVHTRHGKAGVLTRGVDDAVIDTTIEEFEQIWADIRQAATAGRFPCQTSPLCNWCDAQTTTCPAWQDDDGQPVDINTLL